jgi:Protein of unknown function (DUF2934)
MIAANQVPSSAGAHNTPAQHNPEETPENEHTHTLDEIQRRAFRIHRRHGGTYGGYTLEDWLEAEHELDREDHRAPDVKDHIH